MGRNDTLNVAILLMNVLLGGLCLGVARGGRDAPALRYWGWGLFVYTFGLLTVLSAPLVPRPVAYFFGNAVISWAPLISVRGLIWHTPTRFRHRWVAIALVPVISVLVWNNFVGEFRPLVNIVAPTLIAIAAFAFGALKLMTGPPADARAAARLVAVACLVAAGVWSLRLLVLSRLLPVAGPENAQLVSAAFAIAQILVSVAATFGLLAVEVRSMEASLRRAATSDALTGLPNRLAVTERFDQEVARATRLSASFAFLLFDVDHFKKVNDLHGHLTGDAVLRHVGAVLMANKRTEDVLARIGGDEFLLLLVGVHATANEAVVLADRLRLRVQDEHLSHAGKDVTVTVSGGLAMYPGDGSTWEALFATADGRLYDSKGAGRNRLSGPS